MTWARRAALLVTAASVLVPAASSPAATAGTAAQEPRLTLASQTTWARPGGEFALRVEVDGVADPSTLELAVTVHRQVRTRSSFTRTIEGRSLGSVVEVTTAPLAELTPDVGGAYGVRFGIQGRDQPRDPALLQLPGPGVHPVQVELRERGGETLDAFTTHLVNVGEETERTPLAFTWVLPLHAPPSLRPDLTRPFAASETLGPVAEALANSRVPVVLAPTPETLEAWAASDDPRDQDALATLQRAASRRQVLALPYVPLHLGALRDAGLATEIERQREVGLDTVTRVLGIRPDNRVWIADDGIDEDLLDGLVRDGVLHAIVPESRLTRVELLVTLAQPFSLRGPGERRYPALMADDGLATHFRDDGDQVLLAHQLLADLAVLSFDQPGLPRGVVALPPPTWRPSAAFLAAALDGLATSPLVRAATTHDLLRQVPPARTSRGRPLVRRLASMREARLGVAGTAVTAALTRQEAFASLLTNGTTLDDDLADAVLVAEGASLSPARRTSYLDAVQHRITTELGQIEIPGERTIRLTARQGEIPVTFRNRAPYPVDVVVRLDSDKLELVAGATRVHLPAARSHTERFRVRTRTSGAFPLRVVLTSPRGDLLLGQTRFTIRSTAASGVAIFLSVGAGLFLLVWWIGHFRGRRAAALVPS